jgi:hypothetical protein
MSCNKLYVKKFSRNIDLKDLFVPSIFKNSVYKRAFKRKAAVLAAIDVYGILHSLKTNPFFRILHKLTLVTYKRKTAPVVNQERFLLVTLLF